MPKGQQKSNKEVKKPKQTKKPLAPGAGTVIPAAAGSAKRSNPPGR